ncbi:MAG: polymer-forming cytoskeletal protein [Myxococcota bacterium]
MSLFGRNDTEDAGSGPSETFEQSQRTVRGPDPAPAQRSKGDDSVANIGESIVFKGDLSGQEDLVLEGTVEGRVELPDNQLTIGATGRAHAELNAKTIVVVGRVTGNIRASERIEIQTSGIVEGDVSAPCLVVAEGAVVNGSIEMGAAKKGLQSAASPPASPPVSPHTPERKAG